MKMAITRSASTPLVQLIVTLAIALLVWLAMSPEFFSNKSPGDFVAFLAAAGLLAKPIRQLTQINAVIQRGLSASYSVFTLLDEEAEKNEGTYTVKRAKGEVEYREVDFSYNGNGKGKALNNISFTARPGQTIALIGKSGSGKSSIINLLPRFYEHNSGQILLDKIDLKKYTLENLREQISIVTQQVVLFNGTIAENIAYGFKNLSEKKIEAAANDAYAMEFIKQLPLGLHTQVGDDAMLLSGGQRQRLAIARALLKDSPILILDEATSALDTESEQYIQKALRNLIKDRTTFIVAHRLSTIENADLILVLDKGRIVESGRHQDLIARRENYYRSHKRQFEDNEAVIQE
jgi:subfamily B ATP-binding cassette protein MsbA